MTNELLSIAKSAERALVEIKRDSLESENIKYERNEENDERANGFVIHEFKI